MSVRSAARRVDIVATATPQHGGRPPAAPEHHPLLPLVYLLAEAAVSGQPIPEPDESDLPAPRRRRPRAQKL